MTLVVETGEGLNNANSYASRSDGDDYHARMIPEYATVWTGADNAHKEAALMFATRVIDMNVDWNGYRRSTTQALEWPRIYVTNDDDYYITYGQPSLAVPVNWGPYFPIDQIPPRLKYATCELARELLTKDRTKDWAAKGISRLSLGQGALAVDFDQNTWDKPNVMTDQVRAMLQVFGTLRLQRTRARVNRA